jgi:hypothetical protein
VGPPPSTELDAMIPRTTRAPPRSSLRRRWTRIFTTKQRRHEGAAVLPPALTSASWRRRLRQRHRMRCSIGRWHHRRGCNIAGEVISRLARSRRARIPRAVRAANREHPRGYSERTRENPSPFVASFLRGENFREASPPRRAWRGTSRACSTAVTGERKSRTPKFSAPPLLRVHLPFSGQEPRRARPKSDRLRSRSWRFLGGKWGSSVGTACATR